MKKRRQHFVWREYLRAWSTGELIWCRQDGRIFKTNLTNVAQIRDFYKLKELNASDVELICRIAIEHTPLHLQTLNKQWISLFSAIFRWKSLLEKNGRINGMFEKLFNEAVNNFEEDMHGRTESKAIPYIQSILKKDIRFFETDLGYMEFIYFLCIQYLRTNRMKCAVLKRLRHLQTVNIEKVWNILTHIFATNMAWSFYAERESYRAILLKNQSQKELITGDQPVINTYAVGSPDTEPPKEVEFYYPVSPKLALLITKNRGDGRNEMILGENGVKKYNSMIVHQSHSQVYASRSHSICTCSSAPY